MSDEPDRYRARLIAQAHDIGELLRRADVGAYPLAEGVRLVIERLEEAEAERDRYKRALEDILTADDTSTLAGAVAIATAALQRE